MLPGLPACHDDPTPRTYWSPIQYFKQYIYNQLFEELATFTNQREFQCRGVFLNCTAQEMKVFFGISIHMACLGYPRIKMFWAKKTKVPSICHKMSRDRFFKLRSSLKLVDDLAVTEVQKRQTFCGESGHYLTVWGKAASVSQDPRRSALMSKLYLLLAAVRSDNLFRASQTLLASRSLFLHLQMALCWILKSIRGWKHSATKTRALE